MRVTREEAAASRERILDEASHLIRERGVEGAGVAQIMKAAGLTHGGFYSHFASKEDLVAQACRRALAKSSEKWERIAAEAGPRALAAIARSYLSPRHRDDPATGCAVATLASEAWRQDTAVRRELTAGIESQIAQLAHVAPGRANTVRRKKAIASYAAMVGAMVLARVVDDPGLSKEILEGTAAAVR